MYAYNDEHCGCSCCFCYLAFTISIVSAGVVSFFGAVVVHPGVVVFVTVVVVVIVVVIL